MLTNLRKSTSDCICIGTKQKSLLSRLSLRMFHSNKKNVIRVFQFFTVMAIITLSSCRKELNDPVLDSAASTTSNAAHGRVTADAGPVRRIVYPENTSVKLYGSGQGRGITFKWKQIDGNDDATIDHPNDEHINVSHLKPGVYTFSLTVTDRNGISTRDTTSVTVLEKMTWHIEGTVREALVHIPRR